MNAARIFGAAHVGDVTHVLSDECGSDEADHKVTTNESSDSITSEFEEVIYHLLSLTKGLEF